MRIRDLLSRSGPDKRGPHPALSLAIMAALAALLFFKALGNYQHQDYLNSNFFSFWLSGHMAWNGESPYDTSQFLAGFDRFGATYRPSRILQYPLPLMYFLAPLGLLPIGPAYFVWQLVSELAIAATVLLLIRREPGSRLLFPLLTAALLFFGPAYLSLQVGSVGIFSLLAITLAIVLLQKDRPFLAGVALAVTLLKPPQALTLMLLIGIWFVFRRQWRAIAGVGIGSVVLLAVWLLRDPQGLIKFRGSSDSLLGHTLGVQSNVYSFAYLACGRNATCMWALGTVAALVVVALGVFLLWRNRTAWSDWQAFNIIIPLGFLSAIYLWSYDQMLYIIPVVWIASRLFARVRSYAPVVVFLIVIDLVSFIALAVQATSRQDLASLVTTLLILGLCLWLQHQPGSAELHSDSPIFRPT